MALPIPAQKATPASPNPRQSAQMAQPVPKPTIMPQSSAAVPASMASGPNPMGAGIPPGMSRSRAPLAGKFGQSGTQAPAPPTPLDDLNKAMEDSIKAIDSDTAKQQGMLTNQMLASQRAADVVNSRLGNSIGGGYAQLQGAAQGAGMDAIAKAGLAGNEQKRNMMLAMLDKKLQQANRQEERGWQQDDRNEDWAREMDRMRFEKFGTFPTAQGAEPGSNTSAAFTPEQFRSAYNAIQAKMFNFGGISSPTGQAVAKHMQEEYMRTGKWPSVQEIDDFLQGLSGDDKSSIKGSKEDEEKAKKHAEYRPS